MQPLVTRVWMEPLGLSVKPPTTSVYARDCWDHIWLQQFFDIYTIYVGEPGWPGSPLELPVIQHLLLALIPCAIDRLDAALI